MSQSYPYLTLARRLCLKYGHVLAIVDELDSRGAPWVNEIEKKQVLRLHSPKDFDAIYEAWQGEQRRRREVLADEDTLSSDYHKSFVP